MTTNIAPQSITSTASCQPLLQDLVDKFGWAPGPESREIQEEILPPTLGAVQAQTLERAALRCYCAHWYAACCSTDAIRQHAAFAALHHYLFRTASYVAGVRYGMARAYAEQIAADSAQEALLTIWQNLPQVREPGSFIAYVKLIVTQAVLHRLKDEGDMTSLDDESAWEVEDNRQPPSVTPEAAQHETSVDVQSPLETVIRCCLKKTVQQQVIIEYFLHNKTLKQIADGLGRTPGDVRVIKHRALERLKKCKEMQDLIRAKANQPPVQDEQTAFFHLQQVLTDARAPTLNCATVETWLPRYLDDELAGEDVAAKYPEAKQHLDLCPACELLYVELLEVALAEQANALPIPTAPPYPDLSFLPPLPSFATLAQHLVQAVTQQTLQALAPAALADLAQLATSFFQQTEALAGHWPTHQHDAGPLGSKEPAKAALAVLTASYLATEQMARTTSVQLLQRPHPQGKFYEMLQTIAYQLAVTSGLEAAEARIFAQIYATEAQQRPETWLVLIERSH